MMHPVKKDLLGKGELVVFCIGCRYYIHSFQERSGNFLLPQPLQKLLKWASSCISDGLTLLTHTLKTNVEGRKIEKGRSPKSMERSTSALV
jgi:hypothetical protein